MSPQELYQAGRLNDAIAVLVPEVRQHPTDLRRRTFLFELLCFAGEFERAGKHLALLGQHNADAEIGALLYRSALSAEMKRHMVYQSEIPKPPKPLERPGTLNERAFRTIEDFDSRLGPRLEMFVAGEHVLLPLEHVGALRIDPPRYLRDTLWPAVTIATGPSLKARDFGEVLVPALYPFSWRHGTDEVKFGRTTEAINIDGLGEIPLGQRLLLLDGENVVPFLQVRELQFQEPEPDRAVAIS